MQTICEYKDNLINFKLSVHNGKYVEAAATANKQYKILLLVSGEAECRIIDEEYSLKSGCLVIMRDAEMQKSSIIGNGEYTVFNLCFSPTAISAVDPQRFLLDPFVKRPLGKDNMFEPSCFKEEQPLDLFKAICAFSQNPNEIGRAEMQLTVISHLFPLLVNIKQAFLRNTKEPTRDATPTATASDLLAYINSRLYTDISLKSISQHFFLSVSQLERIFKNHVGTTIWEYVIDNRLNAARDKILSGMPAGKTASECGFGDYSAFYRAYLRKFGVSPTKDYVEKSGK